MGAPEQDLQCHDAHQALVRDIHLNYMLPLDTPGSSKLPEGFCLRAEMHAQTPVNSPDP